MFAVLGALLAAFGIFSNRAIYQRSLGININLWWGLVLLAFGIVMYLLGRRETSSARPADETPEGRKMEQREEKMEIEGRRRRPGH
ncbi:MAG TPA: hypothetical protein VHE81_12530 [Lacipirellulaceae bacterium]|nr:hypothetical protein [Lacipirellulaceae bacterium]